jgi:hypothetical protein
MLTSITLNSLLMRLILFLFLSSAVLDCCAQVDFLNRTVARNDSNFVFQGDPNVFAVTGSKSAGWQLRSKYAQIERTDSPWLFKVESARLGPDTFSLIRDQKVVLTKIFMIVPEPPFVVRWGVLKSDTATSLEVISNRRMIMSIPGRTDCPRCKIFHFAIAFISDQVPAQNKMISMEGNVLSPEAANLISKLVHGDKIVFKEIRVVAFSARVREWPEFTIVIK